MPRTPEDILWERLRQGGLEHKADAILSMSAPCIWLDTRRADDDTLPVGTAKLGGLPDLPSNVAWPSWRGQPMAFIAQVRLDEVAPYDAESALPHTGMLSFFFATDGEPKGNEDDDDPTSWRVLHLDGQPDMFARRTAPAQLEAGSRFPASTMSCSRWVTLPDVTSPAYETLTLTNQERNAYIEIAAHFHEDERDAYFGTYLLGHPYVLNGSPLLHSYRTSHGIPYPALAAAPYGRGREVRQQLLADLERAAAAEWRVLFQTDGGASEIDWAGGGILHVTIPIEALRRRDFGQAWMDIDFV